MATPAAVLFLPLLILTTVAQARGCCSGNCSQGDIQSRRLDYYQLMADQLKIKKLMATYNETKDWPAASRVLAEMLDHDGKAYESLQHIDGYPSEPLWHMATEDHEELVNVLVTAGDAARMCDTDGRTLMLGACQYGRTRLVEMMLDHGADANTALLLAIDNSPIELVRLVKERGADLNSDDYNSDTALHKATTRGSLDIVRYLVEAGANTTTTNNAGLTPYDTAVRDGITSVSQYLSQFPH